MNKCKALQEENENLKFAYEMAEQKIKELEHGNTEKQIKIDLLNI